MAKTEQKALPGMEDREFKQLHASALSYARIRDKRMKLNTQEADLKAELLSLVKKHKKQPTTTMGSK